MNEIVLSTAYPVMTIQDAIERRNLMVEVVQQLMKDGSDYGVIPGTADKKTLLKPGAEKLCTVFGLSPRFALLKETEDWTGEAHGGEPFFYYKYRCQLWRGDALVAESEASANSWEKKYRYRNSERLCPYCDVGAIIKGKKEYGGGWLCYKNKGGCGQKFTDNDPSITEQEVGKVANPDIADVVNTLQKMAQKRALVGTTLIAVNASEFFTQDVEDLAIMEVPVTRYNVQHENNVPVVQSASESPQAQTYANKSQIKRFHDLGKAYYQDDWAKEGAQLLEDISEGRTDNTSDIYEDELKAAIDCLVNLLEQEPTPDM